jgi:hypothetical protein
VTDNSGQIPTPADLALLTLRDRAVLGLAGVTAVTPGVSGGFPAGPFTSEPAGDAVQMDIPNILNPKGGRGEGATYQPHPALPSSQHLDYLHKFTSTSLLTLGLGLLIYLFVVRPKQARALVAHAGLNQVGI